MPSKITNEILAKLKKNNKEQVYAIKSGNTQGIQKVIKELQSLNIHSEETFFGNKPFLYVYPSGVPIEIPKKTKKTKANKIDDGSIVLEPLTSSNVHKVKWVNGNLYITFKSNLKKEYEYPNVPVEEMYTMQDLYKKGESVGSYIARSIKPKYSVNS